MSDTRAGDSRTWGARVLLAAAVLLGGLYLPVTEAEAATKTVRASKTSNGWKWKPAHVFIERGDRIKWTNPTKKRHNIVAYSDNWNYKKGLPKKGVRRRQFKKKGNFYYRCTLHSALLNNGNCRGQCGIIHVN